MFPLHDIKMETFISVSDTLIKILPGCDFRALNAADSLESRMQEGRGQNNSRGGMKGSPNRLLHCSVVSAGRFSLPGGHIEGAGAASAGFHSPSFHTLIVSAFCPPSYRSPPPPPDPARHFSVLPHALGTGTSVALHAPEPRSAGLTRGLGTLTL